MYSKKNRLSCVMLLLLLVGKPAAAQNLPEAYPILAGQVSQVFAATAAGKAIPVAFYKGRHYLRMAYTPSVVLDIQLLQPTQAVQIQPAIPFTTQDAVTHVQLKKPGYHVLTAGTQQLFILADSSYHNKPAASDAVSVAQYGADSSGKTPCTAQLQRAINESAARGQILVIGPGIYTTGTLRIGSNARIYLAGGCMINASTDTAAYATDAGFEEANEQSAAAKKFSDNGEYMTFSRLILIDDARNVKIWGHGIINGNGHALRQQGKTPNLIRIRKSSNVLLEGICLFDPAAWNTHILYSDNVTIRNIKMINDPDVKNTDGFDPDASTNVTIEHCFAWCSDDNVAVKSTNNGNLLRNCENIRVNNCVFMTKKSALKVGTETRAALMQNIRFTNNHILEADRGLVLYCYDGAVINQVYFKNNRFLNGFNDNERKAIHFVVKNRNGAGSIRNVYIEHCVFSPQFHQAVVFTGLDEKHRVENIHFRNVSIGGRKCTSLPDLCIEKNAFVGAVTLQNN